MGIRQSGEGGTRKVCMLSVVVAYLVRKGALDMHTKIEGRRILLVHHYAGQRPPPRLAFSLDLAVF